MAEPTVQELRERLDGLTVRDAARLGRRLNTLRGAEPGTLRQLADLVGAAETLVADRHAAVPTITYPDLPSDVNVGDTILLDDGLVRLTVLGVKPSWSLARVRFRAKWRTLCARGPSLPSMFSGRPMMRVDMS